MMVHVKKTIEIDIKKFVIVLKKTITIHMC